jgi:tRNA U34 5-methylaminomethyl-2-thiouridine-forming methyltransferase MnmC
MSNRGQCGYKLVKLTRGGHSVHSLADAETFHPGIGPVAEAEALYVRQLQLPERVAATPREFVLWDVGFGAAANAITAIRLIRESLSALLKPTTGVQQTSHRLRLISFDRTADAAAFALQHKAELDYLAGFESALIELLENRSTKVSAGFLNIEWQLELGDFPDFVRNSQLKTQNSTLSPHAILFDPHSPKKNPAMWTVPLFTDLFRQLDPSRPCSLATFTRSTMARAAMLLGGFFVGAGHPSGLKEETTVAANRIELLAEPLDRKWLERAERSDSAEPLFDETYRQSPLSPETLAKLKLHPQFAR